MLILLCAVMTAGAGLVAVGLTGPRGPVVDATTYLRSLDDSDDGPSGDAFDQVLAASFLSRVLKPIGAAVVGGIGKLAPVAQRDRVGRLLLHAGLGGSVQAEDFFAGQVLAAVGGVVAGLVYLTLGGGSPTMRLGALGLLAVAGVLGPQSWLNRKVAARKHAIFMDLPDVLDLLAISVEAGVGFEGAIDLVCQNFDSTLALEFSRTLKEMELGLPRREALHHLKARTEVPELSNFVLALTQADALGMPIGRVLHSQAGEMRLRRRQWAREKAGKLPVKILFPLMAFIFPAIMIIVLGPAAATIGNAFH